MDRKKKEKEYEISASLCLFHLVYPVHPCLNFLFFRKFDGRKV